MTILSRLNLVLAVSLGFSSTAFSSQQTATQLKFELSQGIGFRRTIIKKLDPIEPTFIGNSHTFCRYDPISFSDDAEMALAAAASQADNTTSVGYERLIGAKKGTRIHVMSGEILPVLMPCPPNPGPYGQCMPGQLVPVGGRPPVDVLCTLE